MPERLLDVSGLEAPEPLLRAIETLQSLERGEYLHLCHRMKPCHLYRFLEDNGFHSDTRCGTEHECEVFVWHDGDTAAGVEAASAADSLKPWVDEQA
ncbi:MAG: DUF2249 domain-containing protein [Candidatus Thiodiazotropha sp.]